MQIEISQIIFTIRIKAKALTLLGATERLKRKDYEKSEGCKLAKEAKTGGRG